jgi:hypothetical protein
MQPLRRLYTFAFATLALGLVFSCSQVAFAASPNIVISQVYGGGGNAGTTFRNDFIELFNRGTAPVNVTGWTVQYASTTGTTWQTTVLSGTIQPGRYYLVQEAQGAGGTTNLPTPDAIGTIAMSGTGGKVALVNNSTPLSGACPLGATVIDFVGYGAANCSETAPTAATTNTTAAIRKNAGTTDTDNNSTDFVIAAPTPRNSASAAGTVLVISEFRTFGPTGTCDEFVEIYNATDSSYTVTSTDAGSLGFAVAQSNGNVLFTIPNNTIIPARGHYLAVNNGGGGCTGSFSGSAYPAGNGTTATGDNTLNENILTNAGIALFNTSLQASFNLANRLDAVGSTAEVNPLYVEGTGYPAFSAALSGNPGVNYSLFRNAQSGLPQDANNNETDFQTADINGTNLCASTINFRCQRLGAPGPENLSSPTQRNAEIKASLVDAQCASIAVNPTLRSACRFERRTDAGSGYGSSPTSTGTLSIRRRFTNSTGQSVTRLRFRIVDITTFPAPLGTADLRAISSSQVTATCQSENGTPHLCSDNASPQTVIEGTTLETDALGQSNGGAFNSTLSAGTVTLGSPLANGASVNLQFLLGVEQNGAFRFFINVEALTAAPAPPIANKARATGKARAAKGGN